MRLVLALVLALSPLSPQARAADTPAPQIGLAPAEALSAAMDAVRQGRFTSAAELGDAAGPVGRALVEWHRLRAGEGDFDSALRFLRAHPDWPGLPYLRRQCEELLPWVGREREVVDFFGGATPQTGRGVVALVRAHAALGHEGDAQALAVLAWRTLSLTAKAEAALIEIYPALLRAQNTARLDMALWQGAENAARRAIGRVDDDGWSKLAEARLALRAGRSDVDGLIAAVPETLTDDPGLAWERFRWRRQRGLDDSAMAMMLKRSASAEALGRPEVWADARLDIARARMRAGEYDAAYALAASNRLSGGSDYAALEWLAGYIALRFRDDAAMAERHFLRFRGAVRTPISLGRAGYWLGRAREAQGAADAAAAAYAFGAEYQTSFYGQLAAERAGLPTDPDLAGGDTYPPVSQASFRDSSVFEAGLMLQAAGERDLAERFLVHLTETLGPQDAGSLAQLALRLGEPHIALRIAKQAAESGIVLPAAYFPVVELGVDDLPVPRELALAIARRESEFDPGVASGVGATGLMQVMPGTARDVARLLDLPFRRDRLFSDPSYNATLGSAYLAGLIAEFGSNPVLVAAGYNAGPGRPIRWVRERGDPRRMDTDEVIDWIEAIPFDETRNYVMRIAESLPVYRARLSGEAQPIELSAELSAR